MIERIDGFEIYENKQSPRIINIDIDGNTPVPSYSLDENEVTLFYNHIEKIYEALVNFIGTIAILKFFRYRNMGLSSDEIASREDKR